MGKTRARLSSHDTEWPTLAIAALAYAAFGALTFYYHALPWWLLLTAGGYAIALHGSLQHEVVHGHPSRRRWLNELLVFPSLWLWLPFRLYRAMHLRHHRCPALTCPVGDPESYYLSAPHWSALGRIGRAFFWAHNTLLGRLLLGPPYQVARLFYSEIKRFLARDYRHLGAWLAHALAAGLVLGWVVGICAIPLLEYLLLFVYPGLALSLLRSYLEHRAAPEQAQRTAVVEAGPLLALLYLNNNLHVAHHRWPRLAWYRLPQRWRSERDALLAANGGYVYSGYWQIVRRYGCQSKETPYHPSYGNAP